MNTATPGIRAKSRAMPISGAMAGLSICVRFILRRNWVRLLGWAAVLTVMIPVVYNSQQQIFPSQADRDAHARVANTPAVAAMTGLPVRWAGSLSSRSL